MKVHFNVLVSCQWHIIQDQLTECNRLHISKSVHVVLFLLLNVIAIRQQHILTFHRTFEILNVVVFIYWRYLTVFFINKHVANGKKQI